jgi:hypothetical protein
VLAGCEMPVGQDINDMPSPEQEIDEAKPPKQDIKDMPFVDDASFEILKEVYSAIDFTPEYQKGNEDLYDLYKEQFLRLLNCEAPFTDKKTGEEHYLEDFIQYNLDDPFDPVEYEYYLFDMDGDSTPELCMSEWFHNYFIYVIKYEADNDKFVLWHEVPPGSTWVSLHGTKMLRYHRPENLNMYWLDKLNQNSEIELHLMFFSLYPQYEGDSIKYAVSLPDYTDKSLNIAVPDFMQKFVFYAHSSTPVFRVTEAQWEELTKDLYGAEKLSQEALKEVTFRYKDLFGDIPYIDVTQSADEKAVRMRTPLNSYTKMDRALTEDDFNCLKEGMSLADITSKVGKESGYVGATHPCPFYELEDGSFLILSFRHNQDYGRLEAAIIYAPDDTRKKLSLIAK